MKRLVATAAVLMMAAACGSSDSPTSPSATPIVFTSQLSAQNEVPAITNAESNARGTVTVTFNVPRDASGNLTGGGTVTFVAALNGFPGGTAVRLAHIHNGAAGVNAGVFVDSGLTAATAVTLDGSGAGTLNLTSSITQDQAQQIMANPAGFYFNAHTALNPGGALRGQLVRQ